MSPAEILKKYCVTPVKSLGQNFLIDVGVIRRILEFADLSEEDFVIEIGGGIGNMSSEISAKAGALLTVEIDSRLFDALCDVLNDRSNCIIINSDILKLDFKDRKVWEIILQKYKKLKIIANLPYYITTPVIFKLLEEIPLIDSIIIMVQKEVAERITAMPSTKEYGALTVACRYYAAVKKLFNVSPTCFRPNPSVESAVIRFEMHKESFLNIADKDLFFNIVKASFNQRRKTLLNSLANSSFLTIEKSKLSNLLSSIPIDPSRRGETLSIEEFALITGKVYENLK